MPRDIANIIAHNFDFNTIKILNGIIAPFIPHISFPLVILSTIPDGMFLYMYMLISFISNLKYLSWEIFFMLSQLF
jgi:hypothetical protein